MISFSLGNLVLAYTASLLAALFALWLGGWIIGQTKERRRRLRRVQCMFCGAIYEGPAGESLPACPRCSRANERIPPPGV